MTPRPPTRLARAALAAGLCAAPGCAVALFGGDDVDPPGAPAAIAATVEADAIEVSWAPASEGGPASRYLVLIDGDEVEAVEAPAGSARVEGLEPATGYRVSVVAENESGRSPPSELEVVTGFSPAAFAGTRLWLDADDAASFTLDPGERVAVWMDRSGDDNHAYQGIEDLMPARVPGAQGGRAVVRFGAAYLTTSDPIQLRAGGDGYTILAVAMNEVEDGVEGSEGRGGVLLGNFGAGMPNLSVELHQDRELRHWWDTRDGSGGGTTGDARFPEPRPGAGAVAILIYYRDAAAGTFGAAVDGAPVVELPDAGPDFAVALPFRIGADYRASPLPVAWKGTLAELLVFDRLLSPGERDRIRASLAYKWGLAADPR